MRVALVTRSLGRGGVPVQVVNLARGLSKRSHAVAVVVLYGNGPLQAELERSGIEVYSLEKRGRWDMVAPLLRFLRFARHRGFDVIQSFLPVENLMSLPVARWTGATCIWGLRGASQDPRQHGHASWLLWTLQHRLLRMPDAIISNSRAALAELDIEPGPRRYVVPNGIDTSRFRPDALAGKQVREELGIPVEAMVIGCIARLDIIKDHPTLLRAAARIADDCPGSRFVVVGGGPEAYRCSLQELAHSLGIGARVHWLGERADPERLFNAFDIFVSASRAEGFSNALAESMACGVAPVVTHVGDCELIVGGFGSLVQVGDPAGLAHAVCEWIELDTMEMKARRRGWVEQEFGIERMIDRTLQILHELRAG